MYRILDITVRYRCSMARNIDTGLLRAFTAVVETGSVTEAAGALSLTQAAVSRESSC
jgi:hypothetical protein